MNDIVRVGADEYSLVLEERAALDGKPAVWAEFDVRADGCVNARWYVNGPRGSGAPGADEDYVHICDLRRHIAQLQEVLRRAEEEFGEGWPSPGT